MRALKWMTAALVLVLGLTRTAPAAPKSCPTDESLSRGARIALVAAQQWIHPPKEKKVDPGIDAVAKALDILETFARENPDQRHPYLTFTLAGLYLEKDHPQKALAQYEETVALCPEFAPAWQNLGKLAFDLKHYSQAAHALETAWEVTEPKNHDLRYHAAAAHMSAEAPDKAMAHMRFLACGQAGPPKENWVKLYVHLSLELKKAPEAIGTLEALLAAENPPPSFFRLATSLYLDQNRHKDAAKSLSAYGLIHPLSAREQMLLADLYNNLGLPYKAARNYEKVETCPVTGAKNTAGNRKKLYQRMAASWMDACEPDKALATADKGLETFPACYGLWKLKGWILYDKEKFAQAAQAFARAAELKKSDTRSLFMHGLCASRAGKKEEARRILTLAARDKQYKKQALGLIRQMDTPPDPS